MIIKRKNPVQSDIDELNSLLALPLPDHKKFLIERELRFLKSGNRGETDSAYFIDFYFDINDIPTTKKSVQQRPDPELSKSYHCSKCKTTINKKAAVFCWDNKQRFGGKAYCLDCQKTLGEKRT